MTTNKKYGKLEGSKFEYAPNSFKTDTGIIMNPPEHMYLNRGWYKVIDLKPSPNPGCYVKFNQYLKDDESKTITFDYVQIMIPVIREVKTYSKLKLETALFLIGKIFEFDEFIDTTMLSNDFRQEISLRKFYDQANDLKSDNLYFETYLKLCLEKLRLTDEQVNQILENSIMES